MSLGSNELVLYVYNTGSLYETKKAILTGLAKKKRRGNYSVALGTRAMKRLADLGAKSYVKDLKLKESWNRAFTVEDRNTAAKEFEAHFRDAFEAREYEYLLPEKMRRKELSREQWTAKYKREAVAKKKKKKTKKGTRRRCPIGTDVQTLIFSKELFTERRATDWARRHNYRTKFDETSESYRIRQRDPDDFEPGSFASVSFGDVMAVLGCPKKKKKKKRGGVEVLPAGMRAKLAEAEKKSRAMQAKLAAIKKAHADEDRELARWRKKENVDAKKTKKKTAASKKKTKR